MGTPALDWFNSIQFKLPTDRTLTSFSHGFYWVNTPPRFTSNVGVILNQGGTIILTTAMFNATDTEDPASDVRFVLGAGGAPIYGRSSQENVH
ncbi:MAG: hypothetical protein HC901_03325 [Bdellovibrionaceae bacterium]|nr:hypothetical protein [Pseudobdellovibrionaceae bacterium]